MENVTYLIGAGASFKAMPLVSDMKERMKILLSILKNIKTQHTFKFHNRTKDLYAYFNPIIEEALKHKTPDTYAKKLWLNQSNDKLKKLKEFLNLYFLFEQDIEKTAYNKFPTFNDNSKEIWENIENFIDERYDVFFATYLEKNRKKLRLPKNVNIISWNYDNQFEIAYNGYLNNIKPKEIENNLSIIDFSTTSKFKSNESNIINLNGNCQFVKNNGEMMTFEKKLNELIDNDCKENAKNIKINFAWEKSENQSKLLNIATDIMKKTNRLVIIGYSFPIFNRDIDKELIGELHNIVQINIQVPFEDEYEKIKDRMQNYSFHSEHKFRFRRDCDQFYIP